MTSRKNVEIPSIGDSKKAVFDPTGGYCKRGLVAHRRVTPRFSGMVIDPFWVCLKTGHTVPPNGKFNLARNANLINRVVFIVVFFCFSQFSAHKPWLGCCVSLAICVSQHAKLGLKSIYNQFQLIKLISNSIQIMKKISTLSTIPYYTSVAG